MVKYLRVLMGVCLAVTAFANSAATAAKEYKYTMKVSVTAPKSSGAESMAKDKTKPSSVVVTPCSDVTDAISFAVSFDAGKNTVNTKDPTKSIMALTDSYVFFYNPAARGEAPVDATDEQIEQDYPYLCERDGEATISCDPKVVAVVRPSSMKKATKLVPLVDVNDIVQADHKYLAKETNLGGKISETLTPSYMVFDEMPKGTWSVVAIVGPKLDMSESTSEPKALDLDFTDPSTWAAWDSDAFIVGAPWTVNGQSQSLICE